MTGDRRPRLLLRRFAITFALAAVVIGAGLLIVRPHADDSADGVVTVTTPSASPTSLVGGTSGTVAATEPNGSSVGSTVGPDPIGTDGAGSDSTVDPVDPADTIDLQQLPRPDVTAHCVATYGDGASATGTADTPDVACLPPDGAIAIEVVIDTVCTMQFGEPSRPVRINIGESSFRCTSPDAQIVADLDFMAYCPIQYGKAAKATLYADDFLGWRCAVIKNGVFDTYDVDVDLACQTIAGGHTFADYTDTTVSGWKCYGVP